MTPGETLAPAGARVGRHALVDANRSRATRGQGCGRERSNGRSLGLCVRLRVTTSALGHRTVGVVVGARRGSRSRRAGRLPLCCGPLPKVGRHLASSEFRRETDSAKSQFTPTTPPPVPASTRVPRAARRPVPCPWRLPVASSLPRGRAGLVTKCNVATDPGAGSRNAGATERCRRERGRRQAPPAPPMPAHDCAPVAGRHAPQRHLANCRQGYPLAEIGHMAIAPPVPDNSRGAPPRATGPTPRLAPAVLTTRPAP